VTQAMTVLKVNIRVTANYYYPDWGHLVDFLQYMGQKIAGNAGH